MKLIKRIIRKIYSIIDKLYIFFEEKKTFKLIKNNIDNRKIYLFSNPIHSNLGDQAQTYCILKIFENQYPDHTVICIPKAISSDKMISLIKDTINSDDKIFIHSGYLIFDPHPQLPFIAKVVSNFTNNRIVILSQTVLLEDEKIIKLVKDSFDNHKDLILMCRDKVSMEKASVLFKTAKLKLWPDFVTSLIGDVNYENKRNGILFCLRDDSEKYYSNTELDILKSRLNNVKIVTSDTTIIQNAFNWKYFRYKLINKVLNEFSSYQLVVTDRYHGTIFSQITSTPVIVLSSSDHKLSSGVKWFPENEFKKNVYFAKNLEDAYSYAIDILKRKGKIYHNGTYFKDNFFNNFRKEVEGVK